MAFSSSRSRPTAGPRPQRPVLAVGQRVFVHRPGDGTRPVALTDERGVPAATVLRDGHEVEILAWRPRGSTGTRYRVRSHPDGADGWLAAEELRATAVRPATPEQSAAEPAPSTGFHGIDRPFGSRA